MVKLTIITQNLNGKINGKARKSKEDDLAIIKEIEQKYKDAYMAEPDIDIVAKPNIDIYAFQELHNSPTNTNITYTIIASEQLTKIESVSGRAEEIWDKAFPWAEFVSGYWDECDVKFAGEQIKIINFHSSCRYDLAIRYTLLKRLSEIYWRYTILLGDFNAAFCSQTAKPIEENEEFLKRIKTFGFRECTDQEENDKPHYTRFDRKLDHIFISDSLFELLRDSNPEIDKEKPYNIIYIDKVNLNHPSHLKAAFTDHSGIMLTIELPDT